MNPLTITPIGTIHSPYKQKFGIPRQPGLAKHARAYITFETPYNRAEAFEGIDQFSHLWIEFYFHQTADSAWKPSVRPPRLGGNKKLGCFATRSNFRPNNLGLSVVQFERLEINNGHVHLHISGHDLLDQTPIIDIKPYIPYSDAIVDASAGEFEHAPTNHLNVTYSDLAITQLQQLESKLPDLKPLIREVLSQDPRPAYMKEKANRNDFAIQLYNYDIHWQFIDHHAHVTELKALD